MLSKPLRSVFRHDIVDSIGHTLQDLIAGQMSVTVINRLEMFDIHHQTGKYGAG